MHPVVQPSCRREPQHSLALHKCNDNSMYACAIIVPEHSTYAVCPLLERRKSCLTANPPRAFVHSLGPPSASQPNYIDPHCNFPSLRLPSFFSRLFRSSFSLCVKYSQQKNCPSPSPPKRGSSLYLEHVLYKYVSSRYVRHDACGTEA